jgi:hypothetical protein
MTQSPFDQMSKQYLEEVLSPFGMVQRQYEVPGEAKFIDMWFVPSLDGAGALGLLGRMAAGPSLLEPYRNVPSRRDIRVGTMKLIWVQEDERRKAQVDELPEDVLPMLWVLAAKTSKPLLEDANVLVKPGWPQGVYFSGEVYKTGIVAIEQLPETPDTLWVRVLGRGETQERAIREVLALPDSEPRRYQVLRLIASWRVRIDIGELEGFVEREEIMALSEAFLAWEEKLKENVEQNKASTIALNMLQDNLPLEQIARFTGLTIAQLQQLQAEKT